MAGIKNLVDIGIVTGGNNTYTFPAYDGTVATVDGAEVLTNKGITLHPSIIGIITFSGGVGGAGQTVLDGYSDATGSTAFTQILQHRAGTIANLDQVWETTGNSGTIAGTNFIGTTDTADIVFKANSTQVGRLQYDAGGAGTNILFGTSAGINLGTTAFSNVLIGPFAMSTTTANVVGNIAIGYQALFNGTGSSNVAIGRNVMFFNGRTPSGDNNTAIGTSAGIRMSTAANCTFIGSGADGNGVPFTGNAATAIGANALAGANQIVLGSSGNATTDPASVISVAIFQTINNPVNDIAIASNYSGVDVRKLTIASGKKLSIASGGILRIL